MSGRLKMDRQNVRGCIAFPLYSSQYTQEGLSIKLGTWIQKLIKYLDGTVKVEIGVSRTLNNFMFGPTVHGEYASTIFTITVSVYLI